MLFMGIANGKTCPSTTHVFIELFGVLRLESLLLLTTYKQTIHNLLNLTTQNGKFLLLPSVKNKNAEPTKTENAER